MDKWFYNRRHQQKFKISETDDATSLYQTIIQIGKNMIIKNLTLIQEGKSKRITQTSFYLFAYVCMVCMYV